MTLQQGTLDDLLARPGEPAPPSLTALRQGLRERVSNPANVPLHPGVTLQRERLGGVEALVLAMPGASRTLIHFHGGGFRLGAPEVSAGFLSQVAAAARLRVVLPYYSLAPEAPFPAALLEGSALLRAVAADGMPLLLGGDSAGGNLAAVLALANPGLVRGLLLLSPWLDLRVGAASFDYNSAADRVFGRAAATEAARLYLQGHAVTDARVSPLLTDARALATLAPTLIATGSGEVLVEDAIGFAQAAIAAGTAVALHLLPGMAHVEPVTRPDSGFTAEVLRLYTAFLNTVCRSESPTAMRS